LSSIGLNSELLAEELSELGIEAEREVELKSLLSDISREIERLRSITEEYLRYSRIPPPVPQALNLNTLCAELIDFYRAEAERSSVQLILDPDPIPRSAIADPNQVRSALLNLIRNACEALEGSEGIVLVTIRTGSGEAKVTIQDSGAGISSEDQTRIFEPFFSTKPQGTGLGLSMVVQLTRAQGGRVTLDHSMWSDEARPKSLRSQRSYELKGASFSLYFPLKPR
jgi:signal transduction histidine kinase